MGKVLRELGIDITKMSAPEGQEKLLAIKNQLETSFRDAIADIENRIHEAGSLWQAVFLALQVQTS